METSALINWQTFKQNLQKHTALVLQFKYQNNQLVNASYHITEIKQANMVSVDCGGKINYWTDIILQLWEPLGQHKDKAMRVSKALSIIALVEKTVLLNPLSIAKVEFGNPQFNVQQMYPAKFTVDGENLIVDLTPDVTQCKAQSRGNNCGIENGLAQPCAPGTGCC